MHANTSVNKVLQRKGNEVWTVAPDSSVLDALRTMAERNVGALVVTEDDRLLGIFSERDYARKVILAGKVSRDTRIDEVMTAKVHTVSPKNTLQECMELMTNERVRHLPVLEEGRLVGVVSIGDVVKEIIAEQAQLIEQLQGYITGGSY